MELSSLQASQQDLLNQVYSQKLYDNEKHIKLWQQYKDRHKTIIEGLEKIVFELSVNCMVPIGKRALMKGKLVHTNEILVCIGDGYFVKYSAQQAIALCNRRIKRSEEILNKLEQEKKFLEIQHTLPLNYGAFQSEDSKDLVEFWDEKKVEDWKVEHRNKEKEYRQKLIASKDLNKDKTNEEIIDDDFFQRLDELELEEELADELNRLQENQQNVHSQASQFTASDLHKENNEDNDTGKGENQNESKKADEIEEQEKDEKKKVKDSEEKDKNVKIDKQITINAKLTDEEMSHSLLKKQSTCDLKNEITENKKSDSQEIKCSEKTNTILPKITQKSKMYNIKSSKISGKFEVSIIKEDNIEEIFKKSNLQLEKQENKENLKTLEIDNPLNLESKIHSEKSKSTGRRVSFADPHFVEMKYNTSGDYNTSINNTAIDLDNRTEQLTDTSDSDDIIKIEFKHSETPPFIYKCDSNNISNPSDIYNTYCKKPKSILKSSPENNYTNRTMLFTNDTIHENEAEENESVTASTYNTVVQDIQERKINNTITKSYESNDKKRPISRFKLERASKQKT